MRGVLLFAVACFVAVFAIASPKPASALPAVAALDYSHINTDLIEVRKKYNKRYRNRNRYRNRYRRGRYYRPYRYRPYRYRGYRYGRPRIQFWL